MRRTRIGWLAGLLAVLATAGAAQAQQRIGGGGVSGGGGFAGGGGGGGFSGSSGGGFSGGGGGFTGQGGFSGGTGFTGGGTFSGQGQGQGQGGFPGGGAMGLGRGTATYGQTSFMGRYFGNPLAAGLATGNRTGGSGSATGGGAQYLRQFPVPLSFGTPLYDQAAVGRTPQLGTQAGMGTGLGTGLGTGVGLGASTRVFGASSVGVRRAPAYLAQVSPAFKEAAPPRPTPVATPLTVASDLQAVIARSTRLPSRDSITVSATEDGVVVLRGQVRDERERRLAEAILRLSPGVREVRNELTRPQR